MKFSHSQVSSVSSYFELKDFFISQELLVLHFSRACSSFSCCFLILVYFSSS
ncbi:hypothetical protein LguiA_023007 [Lonicera macranthoides]